VAAVLAQPDARTVHGPVAGGGQATVVSSARADAAVVVLRDLPKLPTDRTWQLWMIDPSKTAHSVGLAAGDLTDVINGSVTGMVAFGLSVEPPGGSAKPSAPVAALIPMT
jgi:anti-sigma-K factor RskA